MKNVVPPKIFDKQRRIQRYRRAVASHRRGEAADFLLEDMTDDLIERIQFMQLEAGTVLLMGDLAGKIAVRLQAMGHQVTTTEPHELDEEKPFAAEPYNYIFSLGLLDTVNDLPGGLRHIKAALAENGLFVGQIIGAGSLPTLRKIMLAADGDRPAPRIHPMIDNSTATALLQRAGFNRSVVDSHRLTVRYSNLKRLIGDLRDHGQTNVLTSQSPPIGKNGLLSARKAFNDVQDDDERITETFEIISLTGWK